ncbi:MAG: sulfatase-like hydrolase/transferase [Chloroflexi bacterium]|nr:sulfatase-like hydrolase/transferase [Chloroflexota bacterium]
MKNNRKLLSRRDFLKIAASVPAAYLANGLASGLKKQKDSQQPGVIILVFDALSAENMSLYGYPLQTMPNLERFAENATVYHQHYSAGTYTIPGTASLLSGLYPWSHRALALGAGGVSDEHAEHQLFALFKETHASIGYSQNKYSDNLLYQFDEYLDTHIPSGAFDYENRIFHDLPMFRNDGRVAFSSFDDNIIRTGEGFDASLFFGPMLRFMNLALQTRNNRKFRGQYPDGLPDAAEQFLLSDLVDGAIEKLGELQEPSLSYFHFHPPHHPYRPTAKYAGKLFSVFAPLEKPVHPLSSDKRTYVNMRRNRQAYDEYLLSWDEETGRLFDFLRSSGLMDNNYVIVTSDHGEMFERGEIGHFTRLMYSPLIHIPLLISRPGQSRREDVFSPTSSTDILPSLSQEIFNSVPSWVDGKALPSMGGEPDPDRSIYTIDAKKNSAFAPLSEFSMALTRQNTRLIYYQHPGYSQFEYYDLEEDPEEMSDIYSLQPAMALQMQEEMLQKLDEVNRHYRK